MVGFPPNCLRRFYIVRRWEGEDDLNLDGDGSLGYGVFWCRRFDPFVDSAYSPDDSCLDSDEDSLEPVSVSQRPPTPDPRSRGQQSPLLSTTQRDYWSTQDMGTAKTVVELMDLGTNTLQGQLEPLYDDQKRDLIDDREEEANIVDSTLMRANLADSFSDTQGARIGKLLEGLAPPASPDKGPGEEIIPTHPNIKKEPIVPTVDVPGRQRTFPNVTQRPALSPTAPPFAPRASNNINSTSSSTLEARLVPTESELNRWKALLREDSIDLGLSPFRKRASTQQQDSPAPDDSTMLSLQSSPERAIHPAGAKRARILMD